ncbi:MAG: cytochrome P450 [Anaerolineae bacterium]|nr:cytochrome P450 [Gloeobacterales cyanobacterium ES-bin-313]
MALPDGPRSDSSFQMIQWLTQPFEFLERWSKQYGDMFTMHLGVIPPSVVIADPEGIQQLFTGDQFDSGFGNAALKFTLGENSLLVLDGERHQRQRKLLMPPFHGERMRAYGSLIAEITRKAMAKWRMGGSFAVRPYLQGITMQVILEAVFGLHEGPRLQRLRGALNRLLESTSSPLSMGVSLLFQEDFAPWSPRGKLKAQLSEIDELLYAEIRERRTEGKFEGKDILTLLMLARDEADQPMSAQELRDELITLLIAGHETTASTLSWALYWIHALPEVFEKLETELATLPQDFDPNAVAQLPYLNAVCQETLRLYPIAILASPRVPRTSAEILGHHFEAGTRLFPCIYLAHHREETFPEPKRFRPERFLERSYSPYEFLPFGGGNRRCIGVAFALYEMKLILTTMLLHSRLALASDTPIQPVRRGVTVAPPSDLRLRVLSTQASRPLVML